MLIAEAMLNKCVSIMLGSHLLKRQATSFASHVALVETPGDSATSPQKKSKGKKNRHSTLDSDSHKYNSLFLVKSHSRLLLAQRLTVLRKNGAVIQVPDLSCLLVEGVAPIDRRIWGCIHCHRSEPKEYIEQVQVAYSVTRQHSRLDWDS
jgi:hypothetical protein